MPLPPKHPFPMGKYVALHDILLAERLIAPEDLVLPAEASWETLARVHAPEYLQAIFNGTLTEKAERRLGLPWSPALLRRSRLAAQGTLNAAAFALADGLAGNLAGGTHHAFADRGEGFCVFNDVAVAIRALQARGAISRAAIVDLDTHQGNGTASIFEHDETVFTFSMHGAKNFPFHKERSTLDVELPDGTDDAGYLEVLASHLDGVLLAAQPDIVFYLGGVDPAAGDRFGRLALTEEGLLRRDTYVLETVKAFGAPLVLTLSGGYASSAERTAALHAITYRAAASVFGR
jgi:acetoin utilization deacetylase AcuC-like enzyme